MEGIRVFRVDYEKIRDVDAQVDLQQLGLAGEAIDFVWCHQVLEHIQDDLAAMTELDFEYFQQTLTPSDLNAYDFGTMYFGLSIWLRMRDGTLATGSLAPGVAPRITQLDCNGGYTGHCEPGKALRCIERIPN